MCFTGPHCTSETVTSGVGAAPATDHAANAVGSAASTVALPGVKAIAWMLHAASMVAVTRWLARSHSVMQPSALEKASKASLGLNARSVVVVVCHTTWGAVLGKEAVLGVHQQVILGVQFGHKGVKGTAPVMGLECSENVCRSVPAVRSHSCVGTT